MRVLVDTNVLLDYLVGREPHFTASNNVVQLCAERKVQGIIAAHSISNMFYILRKDLPETERRDALLQLCKIFNVAGIDQEKLENALQNALFPDFEDCLQAECAVTAKSDYIITRNAKDFVGSKIPVVTPTEFLALMKDN